MIKNNDGYKLLSVILHFTLKINVYTWSHSVTSLVGSSVFALFMHLTPGLLISKNSNVKDGCNLHLNFGRMKCVK